MYTLKSFLFAACFLFSNSVSEDFSVTPISTSSGLYFEKIGEVLLSNDNWEFVTSVDYEGYLLFYQYLIEKAREIEEFCEMFNSNACKERYAGIQLNLDRIQEVDESMANFLGVTTGTRRVKRWCWSALGQLLKSFGKTIVSSIFGGESNVDLTQYNFAITDLKNGQQQLQNELMYQRTIFMIDSENKNNELAQLNKNQADIKNEIASLENSFQTDEVQKEKQIKELKTMLDEVNDKIKIQEENQMRLDGDVEKIKKNILDIDNSIKEIKNDVFDNTKNIRELQKTSQLNEISTNFILLMNQFQSQQQILFEVIKNANLGQLDPYILTPSKLMDMLIDIQEHLPEGTKFPYYPNIKNSRKLYKIIKPSVYFFDYKLIFILQIPLVYSKTFNLHKITSLPIVAKITSLPGFSKKKKKFAFILPQEPFIAVDNNYQDYMLMSKDIFISHCSELEKSKYLCRQAEEIFHSQDSKECEINLFKSPKTVPETCNKRIMALNDPMFIQLQQIRSWIYVVPTVENIIVSCGKNRTNWSLEGTGFIRTSENCHIIRHNGKRLQSFATFTSPVESDYSPSLNLTDFITKFDNVKVKDVKNVENISSFELGKLEEVSSKSKDNKMHLVFLSCALFVLVVLISVMTYLIYKKKITWRSIRVGRRPTNTDSKNTTDAFEVKNDQNVPSVLSNNLPPKVTHYDELQQLMSKEVNK